MVSLMIKTTMRVVTAAATRTEIMGERTIRGGPITIVNE